MSNLRASFEGAAFPGAFMNPFRQLAAAVGLLFLAGCGGGGGGGGGQIQVAPGSLVFEAETASPVPPVQDVTVTFNGDGVIGGYAPGVAEPEWLGVETLSQDGNTATFRFSVTHTALAAGTYRVKFRFLTGREDGSNLKTYDMPVTLKMQPAGVYVPSSLGFNGLSLADTPPPPVSIDIGTDRGTMAYTASVSYSGAASGWLDGAVAGTAPGTMQLVPRSTALPPGEHLATVRVTPTSGQPRDIVVSYRVVAAGLQAAPGNVSRTVVGSTTNAELASNVGLGDNGAPLQWRVISVSAPWIQASPASGSTRGGSPLVIRIDRDFVQQSAHGDYSGTVTLGYGNSTTPEQTAVIPVTLRNHLPTVRSVGPSFLEAGRVDPIVLYGGGLTGLTPSGVSIDGKQPASVQVLSDSVARIVPPGGLSSGAYPVQMRNALGGVRPGASLQVGQTPAYAAQVIDGLGARFSRAVYDPKRHAVYAVDLNGSGSVRRFFYNGSSWEQDQFAADNILDIALSANGNALYLSSGVGRIYFVDLDNPAAAPTTLTEQVFYDHFVTLGDGRLLGSHRFGEQSLYDPATDTLRRMGSYTACPTVLVSGDGSRAMILAGGCNSAQLNFIYSVASDEVTYGINGYYYQNTVWISRTGTLTSIHQDIYDSSFTRLGTAEGGFATAFSPDSRRMISLAANMGDGLGQRVVVTDISNPAAIGTPASVIETIPVEDTTPYTVYGAHGVLTPDGKTYILLDKDRFRVIPLAAR